MELLRAKLLENDMDNIKKLGDLLTSMDRNNDKVLSLAELSEGIKGLGLEMEDDEVQEIFTTLDTDRSETLDLDEFFVAVRGCLSDVKLDIVMKAYRKLDKDGSGVIDMHDLKDGYESFNSGRAAMSNELAAQRFMAMFDTNKDNKVTKDEFFNYYAGRCRMSDEKFVKMMKQSWKL